MQTKRILKRFHNSKIFSTLIVVMSSQFPVLLLMMEFTSLSKMSHGFVLFLNCQKYVIFCLFQIIILPFQIMWNTHTMVSIYFVFFLGGYIHKYQDGYNLITCVFSNSIGGGVRKQILIVQLFLMLVIYIVKTADVRYHWSLWT